MKFKLAPLASDVTGRAGGIVLHHNKGNIAARRFKPPRNTLTVARVETRSLFATLQALYAGMPTPLQRLWEEYATERAATPRNLHLSSSLTAMNHQVDADDYVASPWSAPPEANVLLGESPTPNTIRVGSNYPPTPPGFTYEQVIIAAFLNNNPTATADPAAYRWGIAASPLQPSPLELDGLLSGSLYQWMIVTRWLNAEGSRIYSPALRGTQTPT